MSEVRAVAERSYPISEVRGSGQKDLPQGVVAARAQEGLRSYSTFKVRKGSGEEIPFVLKEKRLCFARAAVKRYSIPKVRKTQVRQ